MNAIELLAKLRNQNIKVWVEGDKIRCKAPRGALKPELECELACHKREIITILGDLDGSADSRPPQLTRFARDGDLPLSYAQERLWFLDRFEPDSSAYNITVSRRDHGCIDPEILQGSLLEVVKRHEILRTTFPDRSGKPVQVVGLAEDVPLRVEDLKHLDGIESEDLLRRLTEEEAHQRFDLARGPLLRARLIMLPGNDHVVILSMPHIICDGWSVGVLMMDISRVYEAFSKGDPSPLPELPIQYGDYAQWQRQWLQGDRLDWLVSYWTQQLKDCPEVLQLPTDHQRPAIRSNRGSGQAFTLSKDLSESARVLSREERVTPFITFLGIYGLLLSRYCGEEDILIGSPIANRNRLELEPLIGLFVNTLVLRADCSGNPTGRQFLSRLHKMLLEAQAHQDIPFEKVVDVLKPERSTAYNPLFQVTFVLHNTPLSSEFTYTSGGSMFDLTLYMWDEPTGFRGAFEYNTDIFEKATNDRFVANFQTLVQAFVDHPDRPVSSLPFVAEDEKARVLVEWNRTETEYPREESIADLFEEQAKLRPDAVAVVSDNKELTYWELNQWANELTRRLEEHGVRSGELVGLCIDRSAELVVALIAILKVGGVYVPLDPAYPKQRLAFMIEDTGVRILLTQDWLVGQIPQVGVKIVCISDEAAGARRESYPDPIRDSGPDSLAYIMYTSGSTGRPKGVCIRQSSVVRLVRNTNYINLTPDEVFLLFAPISFDASTFEIWGSLLNGGRLVIAPPGVLSVAELGRLIRSNGVTTLWLTAGLFHQVVDSGLDDFLSVRQLLAGGDILSPDRVRKTLATLSSCVVINGYGPTENTTFTCCYRITDPEQVGTSVPIGKPISNTTVYVLDSLAQPLPIGAVGELYIGGDGLATGYLNRSQLTAEKFIPNPFSTAPAARLYKTGDLVRYRSDGNLEFLGRLDNQVKVRGFRIELGEIEVVLQQHPSVRDAVVVAREDTPGDRRLVAYVVPVAEDAAEVNGFREYLKQHLPEYMVPSAVVVVDKFPLTPNGKVDRDALPPPNYASLVASQTSTRQMSPLELQIAAIWQQVLDVRSIGLTDNFFDLGGHSLLAVRLFGELERALGKRLPLATLFQAPTIEKLATVLSTKISDLPSKLLVPIQPNGRNIPLFLVPGLGGNPLTFNTLGRLLGPDQPLYAFQSRGLDGMEQPFRRIEDIARRYVREMCNVRDKGPYLLGGACMGGAIAFEMAQQLVESGEQVDMLALIETWPPASLRLRHYKLGLFLHPASFVIKAVARHLTALGRLDPRQWFAYLRGKLGIMKEILEKRDVYRGERSIYYQDAVSAANYEAMANYNPHEYAGHIHLFLASERYIDSAHDPRMDWARLAKGEYSVQLIDATDSGSIFIEPHVHKFSEQLTCVLNQVSKLQRDTRKC